MTDDRVEHDSMGDVHVPAGARWGATTQRAVENFPISGQRIDPELIHALGRIKAAAASANAALDVLDADTAEAIRAAALEVADGGCDDHFPIDV
jgi:fumarate hydratase class II